VSRHANKHTDGNRQESEHTVAHWLNNYPKLINTHGLKSLPTGYPVIVPGKVKKQPNPADTTPHPTTQAHAVPNLFIEVPGVLRQILQCDQIILRANEIHRSTLEKAGYAQVLVFTSQSSKRICVSAWSEPLYDWTERDLEQAISAITERTRVDDQLSHQQELEQLKSEALAVKSKLQRWGLFMDSGNLSSSSQLGISPKAFHQRLRDVDLTYPVSAVAEVFAALDTHQLIILSGPPGHGKTRIVSELGKLPGVRLTIVRVRPSWHDPVDLLGYQNPLATGDGARPHITNFTKSLLMAEANPEQLHLILLDEFNLAPVEHYMADFLSLIENRNRAEDPTDETASIPLGYEWPKDLSPAAEPALQLTPDDKHFRTVLSRLLAERNLSGSKVTLPPNVRLIGTVNIDATVELLSPRVVDRSAVIQIGGRKEVVDLPELQLSGEPLVLRPLADLPSWKSDLQALGSLKNDVEERINLVTTGLQSLGWGVQLSPRRSKQAALLADALAKVIAEDSPERGAAIADAIVRMLVLPRFMDIDRDRSRSVLGELKAKLVDAGCTSSAAELTALESRPHNTLSYWVY
jgi:MoxR-like ATPase